MKKLGYYIGIMAVVIILLPLLIVKGCGYNKGVVPEKPKAAGIKILVYNTYDKKTEEMDLEEYIKGVVAAEMPAGFSLEALKAQAVAARTFAYGRLTGVYQSKPGVHDDAAICTDPGHCQAWISEENAKKKWGIFFAGRNWNKIERAVDETKNIIVTYNGKIANTLFHSNSGGRTENSEDVWEGVSVPYLRSVISNGEENYKEYKSVVTVSTEDFINTIDRNYPGAVLNKDVLSSIKILDYTKGGRVKTIQIGNIAIKGTEFRTLFNLHSANFKIENEKNSKNNNENDLLRITVTGYGHGVGMSQCGADYLAKRGGTFEEILKYYYTGADLTDINDYGKSKQ